MATTGDRVIAAATTLLGVPYLLGGLRTHPDSPSLGLDCSELVAWAFATVGITLPWNAQQQKNVTTPTTTPQPGDLVFFRGTDPTNTVDDITHVGIFVGDGKMINAEDKGVSISDITSGFWAQHLAGYGHVTGSVAGTPISQPVNNPPAGGSSGGGSGLGLDLSFLDSAFWGRGLAVIIGAALILGGLTLLVLSSEAGQEAVKAGKAGVKGAVEMA